MPTFINGGYGQHYRVNQNHRFFESYEEELKGINDFEVEATTKFVVWRKNKQFDWKVIGSFSRLPYQS